MEISLKSRTPRRVALAAAPAFAVGFPGLGPLRYICQYVYQGIHL